MQIRDAVAVTAITVFVIAYARPNRAGLPHSVFVDDVSLLTKSTISMGSSQCDSLATTAHYKAPTLGRPFVVEAQCKRAKREIGSVSKSVSIATHVKLKDLPLLENMALRWKGPISAALFVANADANSFKKDLLEELSDDYYANINEWVDIHLVYPQSNQWNHEYPANYLRNVANELAKTSHVVHLDIDFMPSETLHESLDEFVQHVRGKDALAVMAFQFPGNTRKRYAEVSRIKLPATASEAAQMFATNRLDLLDIDPTANGAKENRVKSPRTNPNRGVVERWGSSKELISLPYKPLYAPVVVLPKFSIPYDERFDALSVEARVLALDAAGYRLQLLPYGFVVKKGKEDDVASPARPKTPTGAIQTPFHGRSEHEAAWLAWYQYVADVIALGPSRAVVATYALEGRETSADEKEAFREVAQSGKTIQTYDLREIDLPMGSTKGLIPFAFRLTAADPFFFYLFVLAVVIGVLLQVGKRIRASREAEMESFTAGASTSGAIAQKYLDGYAVEESSFGLLPPSARLPSAAHSKRWRRREDKRGV